MAAIISSNSYYNLDATTSGTEAIVLFSNDICTDSTFPQIEWVEPPPVIHQVPITPYNYFLSKLRAYQKRQHILPTIQKRQKLLPITALSRRQIVKQKRRKRFQQL